MSVKRSLGWMAAAQVCALALQFGSTVVLAHYLTPYETGIYAVALATVGVLSIIQALGLQALIVREEMLTDDISATTFSINAIISVGLAAAIAALSFGGGVFLHDQGVQKVLLVLAVTPLLSIVSFLPSAHLERQGRFKAMALITTIASIVGTLLTIVLAMRGFSYMSVAYAQWANGGLTAILMMIVGRRHVSLRLGFAAWRRVADFGLQMLAVSGLTAVSLRLSDVILGRFLGLGALGIFNRASGLNGMLWNNIHLVVGRVLFVEYAEIHRQGISLRERYMRTVDMITATLWPAFAGFGIVAKPFIKVVYGPVWAQAAGPLAYLCAASMVLVSITMTWELFAATGELRAQTRIEFIRAITALVTFAGGCLISLEAAAAARVLDGVVAVALYRPHLNRMTDTTFADLLPLYSRSAVLVVLAVAPATGVMAVYRFSADAPLLPLSASILAGMILWFGGLVVMKHPIIDEFSRVKPA